MTDTERRLRTLLWLKHGCHDVGALYGDDGELQCHSCGGDFLRQSIEVLAANVDNPSPANFFKGKGGA